MNACATGGQWLAGLASSATNVELLGGGAIVSRGRYRLSSLHIINAP